MDFGQWKLVGYGLIVFFTVMAIWGLYRSGKKAGKNESKLNGIEHTLKTTQKQQKNLVKSFPDAMRELFKRGNRK